MLDDVVNDRHEVFAKLVEHNFKMSTTQTVVSDTFATADVTPTSKKKKKKSGSSSKSKMKEAPTQADGLLSKKADTTRLQHPYPRELVHLEPRLLSVKQSTT